MGEKPESPSPWKPLKPGGEGANEGEVERSPPASLSRALVAPPAGRVCGIVAAQARARISPASKPAWPNSAPFPGQTAPTSGPGGYAQPTAGTARERLLETEYRECPRNASRSTEGARCCAPRDALGEGEHWLGR